MAANASNLPTLLIVHTGEPSPSGAEPVAKIDRAPDQRLASSPKSLTASKGGQSKGPAAVDANECAKTTLEITLSATVTIGGREYGGKTFSLACTEEAVWEYVGLAWLFGGFSSVVKAREAIVKAIEQLEKDKNEVPVNVQAARERVAHYEGSRDPNGKAHLEDWRSNLQQQEARLRTVTTAYRRAAACSDRYHELFRDVWQQLAVAEEELLREYEEVAFPAFQEIAKANMEAARKEWSRYGGYDKSDTSPQTKIVDIANVDERTVANIRLHLSPDGLNTLRNTALNLRARIAQLKSARKFLKDEERSLGRDLPKADVLRKQGRENDIKNCISHIEEVRKADPVLLQVYPDVSLRTSLSEFETLVVRALLAAYQESAGLLKDMVQLTGKGQLRIEPRDAWASAAAKTPVRGTGDFTPRPRLEKATGYWEGEAWEALKRFDLTIPASEVIKRRLLDARSAKNSVWLHLPVRLLVHQKIATDDRRRTFFEAGTLECAALTHLWNGMEELRQEEETAQHNRMLGLFVAGLVLAPFTGGVSEWAAFLIYAAFETGEIYAEFQKYCAEDELARSMLKPIEGALWYAPSWLKLVRSVVARSIDTALSTPVEIPFLVFLALTAAARAIEPGKKPRQDQRKQAIVL